VIRLGFLGVQSKHAEYFGNLINREHIFEGVAVSALWGGDAPERIDSVLNELCIDRVLKTPSELIDDVDAVLILLRDGNEHAKYAVDALTAGKPVFVDKPFAVKPEDAHIMVDTARKLDTPLLGGSTLKYLPAIAEIKEYIAKDDVTHVSIRYGADVSSPFGGYYFYGSHIAEICTVLCGRDFLNTKVVKRQNDVCAIVEYPKLLAMLHSSPHAKGLDISVFGSKVRHFSVDESACYRIGMEMFVNMLKTGTPQSDYEDLICSVELLNNILNDL